MNFINNPLILASPPYTQFPITFIPLFTLIFISRFNCELNINFEFENIYLINKLLTLSKCYLYSILFFLF